MCFISHTRMYKTKSAFNLMTEEHPLLVAWQPPLFWQLLVLFLFFVFEWLETSLGGHFFRALIPSSLVLLNVKLMIFIFQRSQWNIELLLILRCSYSTIYAAFCKVLPTFPLTYFWDIYALAVKVLYQIKLEKQKLSIFFSFFKHSSDFCNIVTPFEY